MDVHTYIHIVSKASFTSTRVGKRNGSISQIDTISEMISAAPDFYPHVPKSFVFIAPTALTRVSSECEGG